MPEIALTPDGCLQVGTGASWEHFHHVADVGIRGIGPTLGSAFEQAAKAMTAAVTDPDAIKPEKTIEMWKENHFKLINDSLGHDVGDALLIEVARRLLKEVRVQDTVARQGGDEFIVLLQDIQDMDSAANTGKRLLDAIISPYLIMGKDLSISASIGVSIYPHDGTDVDTLLKHSDVAMYHAKESGRNSCQFYSADMNRQVAEKQNLRDELRHAIDRGELILHYQPVVSIARGDIAGVEVLLRWKHPDNGFIEPDRFIPVAEESGLMEPISEWVLRQKGNALYFSGGGAVFRCGRSCKP